MLSIIQPSKTAELIGELRQTLNLTQEQLADRLSVTFATVNRWENGHTTPSRLAMKQIHTLAKSMGDRGQEILLQYIETENKDRR
ncbi:MAG: helix-turn-helix transcriptional regulator [Cyanobacteriota bacterium]|nr:helix-turn-helix transcriptional regulator [Cyanobacteriota bacterium]